MWIEGRWYGSRSIPKAAFIKLCEAAEKAAPKPKAAAKKKVITLTQKQKDMIADVDTKTTIPKFLRRQKADAKKADGKTKAKNK